MAPPELPRLLLTQLQDLTPVSPPGFLSLRRRKLRVEYSDGTQSAPFDYDEIERRGRDAVVVAAYFFLEERPQVYLRSCVRPPLCFRQRGAADRRELNGGGLWELPAGLIEPAEEDPGGVFRAASRELAEEIGLDVPAESFNNLGPPTFASPGIIAERQHFVSVQVDPARIGPPRHDGSALEHDGQALAVSLEEALCWASSGYLPDAKTELGLRRLLDHLRTAP